MAKVFVSYSRKDIVFAKRLTAELQKSEMDFWIDWEGIPPTVDWWREIEKGIEEADVFVFLISPDSAKSKVCGQEIDTAVKNGKRVIPIVVRDIAWEDTPKHLGHLNYIFIREGDDFNAAVNKLTTAIQTDYEWAATHRRLQVKALDWERNNKESGFLLRGLDLLDAEQDLALNTSKEPHPTDLQREYVFESRKAADRQRRINTWTAVGAAIALAALSIFGFVQAKLASDRANIALARQLASQAQLLNTNRSSRQLTASLLSIQSMKLYPNGDAASFLLTNNLESQPIITMEPGGEMESLTFSPDGKYLASSVCDKSNEAADCVWTLRIWDAQSGKEIHQFTQKNGHSYNFLFSPNSKQIIFEQCNEYDENSRSCTRKQVRIFEIKTGTELATIENSSYELFRPSPDGKHIATMQCDQEDETDTCTQSSVVLWDTSTGKEFTRIKSNGYPSITFSPNWKYIATLECSQPSETGSCPQNVLSVRKIPSGEKAGLITEKGEISVFTFSPDGKHIASSGSEGTVIWEAGTGTEVFRKPLIYQKPPGVSLVFSPNGERILAASGTTAEVWEVNTGEDISRFTDNAFFNGHITFSPNGTHALMGNLDGLLNVWDITTGMESAQLPHDADQFVLFASFSPDGLYVASAGDDGTARVLESTTGKELARMTHDDRVRAAIFSPDGQFVASTGYDGTVRVWKPENNRQDFQVPFVTERFIGVTKDNFIISTTCEKHNKDGSCAERAISTWEISTGSKVKTLPFNNDVSLVGPSGKYLAAVKCQKSNDNSDCLQSSIQIWDIETGKKLGYILQDGELSRHDIVFSPKDSFLASRSSAGFVIWDPVTGKELRSYGLGDILGFTSDEKYMIARRDMEIRVLDTSTGKELSHFTLAQFFISFAISPNGQYIVFGHADDATIWELTTGNEISRITHDKVENFSYKRTYGISTIAFSPDSQFFVTGSGDQTARAWKTATGDEIARITHEDVVSKVAISPDGKFIASVSFDGVLRVWDARAGQEITRNKVAGCNNCTSSYLSSLSFSSDGRFIVADGHVSMWKTEDIIANACAIMPRNLTRAEWAQFIGDSMLYQAVCEVLPIETEGSPTPTAISTP